MPLDWGTHRSASPLVRIAGAVLLALWLFAPGSAQTLADAEKWNLFKEAESSFRQANESLETDPGRARSLFERAALCYERVVREGGVENGKIFYNIGNVYFRLGDPGRAILNYRRAEELIPGDGNLQQNLEFARSRRVDKIEAKPEARVLQTLFFWHYEWSLLHRARLFVLFFALIWLLAGFHLLKSRSWLRYAVVLCVLACLLTGGSIGVEAYEKSHRRAGVVVEKEIIARKGDSTTYEPSFKEPLHWGTEFELLEQRTGWYRIELADGRQCWIPDSAADLV